MGGPHRRSSPLLSLFALALILGAVSPSQADEPEALFTAIRAAVQQGRFFQSKTIGFQDAKRKFSETPAEGGLLIGFDCGIGKFGKIECVYALRAVYLTKNGEITMPDHGFFSDQRVDNKTIKTKVVRTVRVLARPGYAVGSITLRTGLNINGLSLQFMKIRGNELDTLTAYDSEWIGDRTGGNEASIVSDGSLVIGISGSTDESRVGSLSFHFARPPAPAKPEPPKVEKPVEKPVDPPKVDPVAKPKAEPAVAAPPAPAAAGGDAPPAWDNAQGPNWILPVAIFFVVTGICIAIFLVLNRKRDEAVAERRAEPVVLEAVDPSPAGDEPAPPAPKPTKAGGSDAIKTAPSPWQPIAPLEETEAWQEREKELLGKSESPRPNRNRDPLAHFDKDSRGFDDAPLSSQRERELLSGSIPREAADEKLKSWAKRRETRGGDREIRLAKAVKEATRVLFAVAALQFICSVGVGMVGQVLPANVGQVDISGAKSAITNAAGVMVVIAMVYVGLGSWATSNPFPASVIGLILYVGLFVLDLAFMVQGGGRLMSMGFGLWIRIAITGMLIRAVSTSYKVDNSY